MKTADFLREHNACREGAHWALSVSNDMSVVWEALLQQGRHEWLVWAATRSGVFPDSTLRKLECRFVRETPLADGRKVWDLLVDERSRRAVEVAEAYAAGNATDDDLDAARSAADAAHAAADAAYAAAAYDAACNAACNAADDAARVAAYAAARAAAYDARAAAYAAADDAAEAAYVAARVAAKAAQVQMIAELGNPFKKGADK